MTRVIFTAGAWRGGGVHGRGGGHAGGMHGGRVCMAQGMHGGGRATGEMVTKSGGTHPTGMHSCKDNAETYKFWKNGQLSNIEKE